MFINTLDKLSQIINEDFYMNIFDENIIIKVINTLPIDYEELVD